MTEEFRTRYIAARRARIAADFAFLNAEQRRAVMTTQGPLLLLAGAGSGKTTVLINRIVNLIRYGEGSDSDYVSDEATEADLAELEAQGPDSARLAAVRPAKPWRIIAITFTNKAADELKRRLAKALGEAADDVWAQTFHSACVRILRREADRLGFSRSFTIYDGADSLSAIKRILKDFDLDEKLYPPRWVQTTISNAKDAMLSHEAFEAEAARSYDARRKRVAEIYKEYDRRLHEADAMDFDDLILHTVELLQQFEDVRDYYQRKFQYVLVDEYQDTNHLQYLLTSLLAGGYENLCVVGDDDQSIYKFRGATIRNILDFEAQYKSARVIKLEQNYRSTAHILEAANGVIRNNTERKGKRLWTEQDGGERPYLYCAPNENEEARFVADRILEDFQSGVPWSDHAVLYRMNAQSNQLEYAFKRQGIPYRVFGGVRFFDRAEVKDMLSYLSVLANPADDLRLLRIVNVPARGIGATGMEHAAAIAQRENTSLFEVLRHADQYPELKRAAYRMQLFTDMIAELRTLSETEPLDRVYDALLEKSGYVTMLREKDTPENAARLENVGELKSNILSFIKETGDSSLHGFLDEVALYTDLDKLGEDQDGVVMMTIHSAKGLEFPMVFLVGVEEGIFPGMRAIGEPEEMEEERRLAYVAITRAMKKLYVTCAQQRMLFGKTTANRVSRFVEEIPEEHIEKGYVPRGYGYSDQPRGFGQLTPGGYGTPRAAAQRGGQYGGAQPGAPRQGAPSRGPAAPLRPPVRPVVTPATAQAAPPAFRVGDQVEHKSFGKGRITAMTPMGGDFLVEIAFEQSGAKRLMLRAASRLMQKAE